MIVDTIQGDLFQGSESIIVHGCNAQGVMGKGFALRIRELYPDAFEIYAEEHRRKGLKPGKIVVWNGPSKTVVNCITQATYGRYGQHVSYDAITSCMREIERMARERIGAFAYDRRIAMPKIGSDLGGGDWDVIRGIIETEIRSAEVVVYEHTPRPRHGFSR